MNDLKASFDSTHLEVSQLSEFIQHSVKINEIHYREFTSSTHMNNKNFRGLLDGRDLRLNYYLRFLQYIADYFNTAQAFRSYVQDFLYIALKDMEKIMEQKQMQ